MILVIFDIDGTLTTSFDLDTRTYLDALREEFGFRDVSDDWASYAHATDAGILAEVFQTRRGRPPAPPETGRMQKRYVSLLRERIDAAGGLRPVPGAAAILSRLGADPAYTVSLASGAWRQSARLKLEAAALPWALLPAAFSDDDFSREGICRISRARAGQGGGEPFSRVVYVGDGVWDVRSSRGLDYGFIGINQGDGAAKLRAEGAVDILPDFADADAFLAALSKVATGYSDFQRD